MNAKHFRQLVVRPVLKSIQEQTFDRVPLSGEAEDVLVMIPAHESNLGEFLAQLGGGPALGVFQIEPETANWLIRDYLARPKNRTLRDAVLSFYAAGLTLEENLAANLPFQVALARILLWTKPEKLPKFDDSREYLDALSKYAKTHWNTDAGAAKPEDYLRAYLKTL
jgi:hypothetical protein